MPDFSPPPLMDYQHPGKWLQWKRRFERYCVATKSNNESGALQKPGDPSPTGRELNPTDGCYCCCQRNKENTEKRISERNPKERKSERTIDALWIQAKNIKFSSVMIHNSQQLCKEAEIIMVHVDTVANSIQKTDSNALQGMQHAEALARKVTMLLCVAAKSGLKLNKKKCKICMSHLDFLGHTIGADGVIPSVQKVKAIRNLPKPKDLTPKWPSPDTLHQNNTDAKAKNERYFNRTTRDLPPLSIGQTVRVRNEKNWSGRMTVTERVEPRSNIVQSNMGALYRCNRQHLLAVPAPSLDGSQSFLQMFYDVSQTQSPQTQRERSTANPILQLSACQRRPCDRLDL
ncbi:hypothetical protein CAPTEDRAFT_192971 [Capitella teleta]|uniref:Uncharacterized protein n=1 Tax=Capitella teleta TaxID=283909 RepID=R7TS98_CAPTE|nr:hypothetical protein CAPTEDRAFT_192971 [Capitella teleta]|eukprot:ELT94346.1 hypothetical protein CAPTEDRAFT_192971 [Capitella teleta]